MRAAAIALVALCVAAVAAAAPRPAVVMASPGFPAPAGDVTPRGPRLELVSARQSSPVAPTQQPLVVRTYDRQVVARIVR